MSEIDGRNFWEKTKHDYMPISPQDLGRPQPPLELPVDTAAAIIPLPDVKEATKPSIDLWQAIEQRVSVRNYAEQALTLEELASLLWASQGVRRISKRPATLRTVPSAGARHAFETYLLINQVEGLTPGIYRYAAIENGLLPIELSSKANARLTAACLDQTQVATSAVTFFWAAVIERMTWRYPIRGYRYILLDAGHVCQNLYLAAEALGCGVCAIAAYDDDLLNRELGLDGLDQFVVYAASLGKRK